MREPRSGLAAVDAEPLEPRLDVVCEGGRSVPLVVEDEHADAPCLAVAAQHEARRDGGAGGGVELARRELDVIGGPAAEERDGDVQVVAGDDAAAEAIGLPGGQAAGEVVGKPDAEEEAETLTAF